MFTDKLKKYLITDPKYYSNNEKEFEQNLIKSLSSNKVDFACFRDKTSNNFEELTSIFVKTCKKLNIEKIVINGNFTLAKKLNANAVHLTSTQFEDIKKAKELNLFVIISCHNEEDIENAKKQGADVITYSPIFLTPNKGKPKGIKELKKTINLFSDMKIIALGGIINEEQISQIKEAKAFGFASIRYFIPHQ